MSCRLSRSSVSVVYRFPLLLTCSPVRVDFITNFNVSFIHGPSVRPGTQSGDHPCLPGFRLQRRLMDYPHIHPRVPSATCHRFNGGPCAAHKNNDDSMFTQLIRRFYRAPWGGGTVSWRFDPGQEVTSRGRPSFSSLRQNYSPEIQWTDSLPTDTYLYKNKLLLLSKTRLKRTNRKIVRIIRIYEAKE